MSGQPLHDAWQDWCGAIECTDTGRTWPAGDLREETDRAVAVLADQGVQPGDRVAVALPNTAAFPVWVMACLNLGATPALLSAGLTASELEAHRQDHGIRWLVHTPDKPTSNLQAMANVQPATNTIAAQSTWVMRLAEGTPHTSNPLEQGALLHATSGTFGHAQLCIRNQHAAVAEASNFLDRIHIYDRSRVTLTTPMSHAYAFGFGWVAALLSHSTLMVDGVFNPKRLLGREAARPSDILAIVPPMTRLFCTMAREGESPMAGHVFYAGAHCPVADQNAFEARFATQLHAIYGSTETGGIATTFPTTEPKASGVGHPLPGVSISIRDSAATATLGPDVGEVWVRATSHMQGYIDTDPAPATDGFFNTLDLGRLNPNGTLVLVGRAKEMINLGGRKVDPAEVERVLQRAPDVVAAAVYPGVRKTGDEFVQAAVQLADGAPLDAAALTAHCQRHLEPFKLPHRYHQVDALPLTASGKCQKIRCPGWGMATTD